MNGLSNNSEDVVECPLCMEPLEVDDLNFFPCTCGYQICRFCWHRIRTDENELCPACRKEYPENPADFTPLSQEEILALKSQKRQRDQQRKQKMTENRKHLSNVRVVQKNLVFVVGLPPRLADAEVLKKHEYFGKYGKIHKVVINPSTTYAGVQGPSASAYVTYVNNNDALRAIQSVNNVMIDGRLIKTSLGTTKYCSHFMKNQQCPKSDCMYLHELGDPEASFTKEEMHQGKHQEYEKRLHDALIAILGASSAAGIDTHSNGSISVLSESIPTSSTNNENYSAVIYTQPKEAWPSLSVSPEINKETVEDSGSASGKNKKEKPRNEKSRFEKHTKLKTNKNVANVVGSSITPNTINRENNFSTVKDRYDENSSGHTNEIHNNKSNTNFSNAKVKTEKGKDKPITNVKNKDYLYNTQNINKKYATSLDEEVKEIKRIDKQDGDNKTVQDNNTATNVKNNKTTNSDERSISSSSITSTNSTGNNSDTLSYEDYASGKTSPSALENISGAVKLENIHSDNGVKSEVTEEVLRREIITNCTPVDHTESVVTENSDVKLGESFQEDISNYCQHESKLSKDKNCNSLYNVKAAAPQLSLFDDTSFFSSAATFHQSMFVKNKLDSRQSETANVTPHLPDLLKGVDGYQNNKTTHDWEKSCKNKLAEDELSKQEELCQLHELQKRSNLCSINLPQLNITRNEFLGSPNHFNNAELNKLPQSFMTQPQQQSYQQSNHVSDQLFDTNMLKFFDFHKNQQQQIHQQYLINGQMSEIGNGALSDHLCMLSLLENGRNGPQFSDKHTGVSSPQQQQPIQKHRDVNKPDSLLALQQQYTQNRQSQPNYMQSQFSQNFADDDLGFDPFIETQKGLAELMENEMMQQRNIKPDHGTSSVLPKLQHHQPHQHVMENVQRARLPPPGFNHVNAFGFGMPNAQNTHKVAPFMNGASNTSFQQNLQLPHLWNVAPSFNQQQHNVDEQLHQINQSQILNKDRDWTAMDPAILSFRQCSSYPQQTPMQSQQHELFMQHLKQQQQNTQGLGLQLHGNSNLLHNIHNSQISSQAPVNANVQGMLEYLKTRQFV